VRAVKERLRTNRRVRALENEEEAITGADRIVMRNGVRAAYTVLEREMFGTYEDPTRIAEVLQLTRAQLADDSATNDRQRFAGKRTLSLDGLAESGYEQSVIAKPSRTTVEEQAALEEGMKPFLERLTMDQRDAVRSVFQYSFAYREGARRLDITTAALQRRIKSATKALRGVLAELLVGTPAATPPVRELFPYQEEKDREFLRRAYAQDAARFPRTPRVETTMDMTSGRLGSVSRDWGSGYGHHMKIDPGADVPRRQLTQPERAWLATGAREEIE